MRRPNAIKTNFKALISVAAKVAFQVSFPIALFTCLSASALDDVLPEPVEATSDNGVESTDVTLKKKNAKKALAKVTLSDKKEGLNVVFSSDSLDKGRYVLKLEEDCETKKRSKNAAPGIKLGDFTTISGNISSEFIKEDLSVGEKLQSVANKALSLHKIAKKGESSRVACAIIQRKVEDPQADNFRPSL